MEQVQHTPDELLHDIIASDRLLKQRNARIPTRDERPLVKNEEG